MNALAPISFESALKARYANARLRLMIGRSMPALPAVAPSEPEPSPEPKAYYPPVPLNMLRPCSARFLIRLVGLKHNIPVRYILGLSRQRKVVAARHEAIAAVYQHTQASMPAVGRFFGRDHTTVLAALRKMGAERKLVEMTPRARAARRPQKVVERHEYTGAPGVFCNEGGWAP